MLYYLLVPLAKDHIVFNVFRYLTFRSFMALISAFIISLVVGPWIIRRLRIAQHGGETIRDDATKLRRRKGISTRVKFVAQVVVAFAVLQLVFWQPPSAWLPVLAIPFFKGWLVNLGWLWIPFTILVVVGASNAVNLTDGLDGLAIGPVIM